MEEQFRDLRKLISSQSTDTVEEYGGPVELDPHTNIWERHPEESPREWAMFSIFLNLDPVERSLGRAYKEYLASMGRTSKAAERGQPIPRYYEISEQFRWLERADAYDRHLERKVQAELIDQKVVARVGLAKLGAVLRRKAAEAAALIQSMTVVKSGDTVVLRSALTIPEISQLARLAKDLEMSALGMGDGRTGGGLEVNVNVHTDQGDDAIISRAEDILAKRQQLIDAELTRGGKTRSASTSG